MPSRPIKVDLINALKVNNRDTRGTSTFPFNPAENIRKPKMSNDVVQVSLFLTLSAEAHSEPSSTSKIELFAKELVAKNRKLFPRKAPS